MNAKLLNPGNAKLLLAVTAAFLLAYILGINLTVPAFLVVLLTYLKFSQPDIERQNHRILHIIFIFVLIFVSSYLIIQGLKSVFYIPFAVVPMLSVILFSDMPLALILTLASVVSVAASTENPFYLETIFLTSGILSIMLMQRTHKRIAIINAGIVIGVFQAALLFLMEHLTVQEPFNYLILFFNGLACGIIVIGVLPIFEYLFRTVTDVSLLELTDFSHPILQRMILEAPGTYHHSLIVGNLSEAASTAIGAHALLARVGAYYHDIGKLYKPDYFSENYNLNGSLHDSLPANMSKMVIMNHIKEGVDLAKKYKLNPRIIEFIQQHHGTSLVYYFYLRALENTELEEQIKEEGFRYPGPKPDTKEAAIVLLADSVEAAARSLKDPTPAKIEELVHKVINNKFIDGQLDNCELALRDLEKISAVFIRILSGIYHSRISYPENNKNK